MEEDENKKMREKEEGK